MKNKRKPNKPAKAEATLVAPRKRHTYWSVHYRINGEETAMTMGQNAAAEQAVGVILGNADFLTVTRFRA